MAQDEIILVGGGYYLLLREAIAEIERAKTIPIEMPRIPPKLHEPAYFDAELRLGPPARDWKQRERQRSRRKKGRGR